MGLFLVQIAIEIIETLLIWVTSGVGHAQPPFANAGRFIARLLEQFADGERPRIKRHLPTFQ